MRRLHDTAPARSPFRAHALLATLFALVLLLPAPARAGDYHLLINGKAIHLESRPGVRLNERNLGAGLQYDFEPIRGGRWVPFFSVSGFSDSNRNPSYYAGGGFLRRYMLAENLDGLHVDAGAVAFLMTREGYLHGRPFPGILPALSIGTRGMALNITYIPKVDPKMIPLWFLQLKIAAGWMDG